MIVGYARVSTEEQNLDLQTSSLKAVGCEAIFEDHGYSGRQFDRPGLMSALGRLRSGDKFVVWRLDRLGRSISELLRVVDGLEARNIRFMSITECIDSSTSGGRLTFHIMAALAEFERALISDRTRAGMAAARASGKRVGRPPLLNTEQAIWARTQLTGQLETLGSLAVKLGVHPRTLQRSLRKQV
jgi:DNA invertase Pin-like site-specific DNA recombinase